MQRRRAGVLTATAIAASAVVLASCNAIFGLSSGTVGPDAESPDAPSPDDSGTPDMAMHDASPDVMFDGSIDAVPDGPPPDMEMGDDAMPDAFGDGATCILHPTTADEDLDLVNDQSDLCPHLPVVTTDADGDPVGTACDPWMNMTNETRQTFVGFAPAGAPCNWTALGNWDFGAGSAGAGTGGLTVLGLQRDAVIDQADEARIVAGFQTPPVAVIGDSFAVAMNGTGSEVSCWYKNGVPDLLELRINGSVVSSMQVGDLASPRLELTSLMTGSFECRAFEGTSSTGAAKIETMTTRMPRLATVQLPPGLARVDYVVVYEQSP